MPELDLETLRKRFGGTQAPNGAGVAMASGEVGSRLGENGAAPTATPLRPTDRRHIP